ncbi:hypothetical protein V8G54_025343 [Vigna mungo]|uniref:Uncharacterized protein n=1 Tax=Vigna mungo TaxID=3915 RepID=A0AAQ3RL23_VIGMU
MIGAYPSDISYFLGISIPPVVEQLSDHSLLLSGSRCLYLGVNENNFPNHHGRFSTNFSSPPSRPRLSCQCGVVEELMWSDDAACIFFDVVDIYIPPVVGSLSDHPFLLSRSRCLYIGVKRCVRSFGTVGKFKIPKDLAKALARREGFDPSVSVTVYEILIGFSSAANQHCLPSSIGGGEVASRWLSGAFRSSSLGVKSSIKGFWLTADFLPFAPVVSIIPAVDILCCASSHVVKNVWKVPTQRVKVGCKRAELKYPTVHHFQVGKVHTLVFAMFIVFC